MNTINKDIVSRINKALLYIDAHIHEKLKLEDIAVQAHFSAYHFHRLFSAVVGETLANFINRTRLEKAVDRILHHPEMGMTEIAESLGFSSVSSFSRSFKKYYGESPSAVKGKVVSKFSKICIRDSKEGQKEVVLEEYISNVNKYLKFIEMKASIEVRELEPIQVGYLTHIGNPEGVGGVFEELIRWAFPRGLMNETTRMMTVYHNSPKITPEDKLRMSACIVLDRPVAMSNGVGLRTVPGGKHVVAQYEIGLEDFQRAWEANFVWLSEKGVKVRGQEPFEIYYNDYREHPEKKCRVDMCIPVE